MATAAQKNQGFQHRVRHAGTVWAHYEPTLVKISVKICIWLEQTMPTHKKHAQTTAREAEICCTGCWLTHHRRTPNSSFWRKTRGVAAECYLRQCDSVTVRLMCSVQRGHGFSLLLAEALSSELAGVPSVVLLATMESQHAEISDGRIQQVSISVTVSKDGHRQISKRND